MSGEDFMELGDLIPIEDGWWLDKATGNKIDTEGRIYDHKGEVIYDSTDTEEER